MHGQSAGIYANAAILVENAGCTMVLVVFWWFGTLYYFMQAIFIMQHDSLLLGIHFPCESLLSFRQLSACCRGLSLFLSFSQLVPFRVQTYKNKSTYDGLVPPNTT